MPPKPREVFAVLSSRTCRPRPAEFVFFFFKNFSNLGWPIYCGTWVSVISDIFQRSPSCKPSTTVPYSAKDTLRELVVEFHCTARYVSSLRTDET